MADIPHIVDALIRTAPDVEGIDALRRLSSLRRRPLKTFEDLAEDHGDVAAIKVGGSYIYALRGAEPARHVLLTEQDNYPKGRTFEIFRLALGLGLVTSEGDRWRRSRRMVQPLFAKRHLGVYASHMSAAADAALGRWDQGWEDGRRVDLAQEILEAGLDTVGRALISSDLDEDTREIGAAISGALEMISIINSHPAPIVGQMLFPRRSSEVVASRMVPFSWRRYQAYGDRIVGAAGTIVERREREGHRGADDLLSLLMESADPDTGERLDRRQVIDELRTFIAAGHETTAHGLTWLLWLLAAETECRARVEEEVDRVLGDRLPDQTDLDNLPYLMACFQEALRLYPPAWILPRQALGEDSIGGRRIHAGSDVFVSVWATHRDPAVYPDPSRFDPTRWLDGSSKERPRFSYLPFGGGRRACVGQGFALLNAAILGSSIIRRYRFERPDDRPIELETSITLRAKGGVPMLAHRRQTA